MTVKTTKDMLNLIYEAKTAYDKFQDDSPRAKTRKLELDMEIGDIDGMSASDCMIMLGRLCAQEETLKRELLINMANQGRIIRRLRVHWDLAKAGADKSTKDFKDIYEFIKKQLPGVRGMSASSSESQVALGEFVDANPALVCMDIPFREIVSSFPLLRLPMRSMWRR